MDRDGFITLQNGYRIWYKIVGSGKGIPLLTLHGGPGAGHDYLEPLEALGAERPVRSSSVTCRSEFRSLAHSWRASSQS